MNQMDIDYTAASEDLFRVSDQLRMKAEETFEAFIFNANVLVYFCYVY